MTAWGGRALEWHSRGQRFDPAYLHQNQVPWVFLDIRPALLQGRSFCLLCNRFKIQAPAELLKVDGKFDVQLVAAVNVYPADERADDHLFCLDAGSVVQLRPREDLVVLSVQAGQHGFPLGHFCSPVTMIFPHMRRVPHLGQLETFKSVRSSFCMMLTSSLSGNSESSFR